MISKITMDHELEKMRKAASCIFRYNTNIVRLIEESGHHGQDNEASLRYERGTS